MNEVRNEVKVVSHELDSFGYPMSDRECEVCHAKMYRVAKVVKRFSGVDYEFIGYKCVFCGQEDIVHEKGGVLGNGKD